MTPKTRAALIAFALVCPAAAASAQVMDPPPRSTEQELRASGVQPQPAARRPRPRTSGGLFGGHRPTAPGRMSQRLTVTFDLLGGYDDDLGAESGGGSSDPSAPHVGGMIGNAAGILDYAHTSDTRGFEASARSVVATYQGIDVEPLIGGRGHARGFFELFDQLTVDGWAEADYRPTFSITGIQGAAADPTAYIDPSFGVTELRSTSTSAGGGLAQDWSNRQHSTLTFTHSRMNSYGLEDLDSRDLRTMVGHTWDIARSLGIQGEYIRSRQHSRYNDEPEQSLNTQTGTAGLEVRIPISPTRRLTLSGRGGATRVETRQVINSQPASYTTPAGSGSLRVDIGRTWALSADAGRSVSMLSGLTQQAFVTNAATVWAGGYAGRFLLTLNTTYARGTSRLDVSNYHSVAGMAQVQTDLTRWCSLVTSYSFYRHELESVFMLQPGFPASFERHALRVGLTVQLPLYGTFPASARRAGR